MISKTSSSSPESPLDPQAPSTASGSDDVPDTRPPSPDTLPPATNSASWAVSPPSRGDITGYEIVRELGRGSMGVVYEAVRKATGERAALKVITPLGEGTEVFRDLFLREARVLKDLNHPRIVRFLESGLDNQRPFLAMEYVAGIELDRAFRLMPAGRVAAACSWARQALEGLAYAHAKGFVHRDVKPTNILIAREDDRLCAKIADFGVAKSYQKANQGQSNYTRPEDIRGTLVFMSPEQVIDSLNAKPAADVYAMAATLYYWLTDRFLYDFRQPTFDNVCRCILNDDPVPLLSREPALPSELSALIHEALARQPDARPTASEFRQQLKPFTRLEGRAKG